MTGLELTISSSAGAIVGLAARELPRIIMENVLRLPKREKKTEANGNGHRLQLRDDVKEVFVDTLKQDILPVLNQQVKILEALSNTNTQMKDGILILVERSNRMKGGR